MIDATATHLVPLITALTATNGAVIEIGMGIFSTDILRTLCEYRPKRPLTSIETNEEWYKQYKEHPGAYLVGSLEETLDIVRNANRRWAVALIDGGSKEGVDEAYEERKKIAYALRPITEVLVIHDTEDRRMSEDEEWKMFVHSFRFRWIMDSVIPHTMTLSDIIDVRGFLGKEF